MLIASFTLKDYCGNKSTVDVRKTTDGELTYSFYGTESRIPFCLGNLQMRIQLPKHINSCKNVIESVRFALGSGNGEQVIKVDDFINEDKQQPTKVVIYVEGGVVTGCTSNDPTLRVILIDRDNLKESPDPEAAEKEMLQDHKDCVHNVS